MDINIVKPNKLSSMGAYLGQDNIDLIVLDEENNPVRNQKINIFKQNSNVLLESVHSNGKGEVKIIGINLKLGPFFVVAHDRQKKYNGVISDYIGGPDYVHEKG